MSKQTGKEIGGINQFASLGGTRTTASSGSDQELKHETVAAKTKTTATKRERERITIYLPPHMVERIRLQAATERKEISEVVEEYLLQTAIGQ
jgi:hypothetical protein